MRPSSVLRGSTAPVMPIGPLDLSCRFLGSSRIRIQQRSGFNTLGRTSQSNKPANHQDAEHYLDVHRSSPPPRLSGHRSALDTWARRRSAMAATLRSTPRRTSKTHRRHAGEQHAMRCRTLLKTIMLHRRLPARRNMNMNRFMKLRYSDSAPITTLRPAEAASSLRSYIPLIRWVS
jgi:hypothetical protein